MYENIRVPPSPLGSGAHVRTRHPSKHVKWTTIGPPAKRHRMAFRWRADSGPILDAGWVLQSSIQV